MKFTYLILLIFLVSASCSSDSERKNSTQRFFLRGKIALEQNKYLEAVRFFGEAIQEDTTFAEAYNNMGIAYYYLDEFPRAIYNYNKAIDLVSDSTFVDAYYNRSNAYYELDRFEEALQDLNVVQQNYPDSAYVYLNRSTVWKELNQNEKALQDIDKAIELNPQDVVALVNKGSLLYLQKEFAEAKPYLEKALELDSKQDFAQNSLGLLATEEGDFPKALEYFNQAILQKPAQAYYLNNRAYVKIQLADFEGAKKDLETSQFYNSKNAWLYRNWGLYHLKQEDSKLAIKQFQKALTLSEQVEKVHFFLAQAFLMEGNQEEACATLKEGLEKGENSDMDLSLFPCKF